jgi:hypothetical protein
LGSLQGEKSPERRFLEVLCAINSFGGLGFYAQSTAGRRQPDAAAAGSLGAVLPKPGR